RPRALYRRHAPSRPLDRPHLHRELPRPRPQDRLPPQGPAGGGAGWAVASLDPFRLISQLESVETIAEGNAVRDLHRPSPKGEGRKTVFKPLSFRRGVGVRSPKT